jgi:hypothetical protein
LNTIRVEGVSSVFFDAPSSATYSSILFNTFLVINAVTVGGIPSNQFCVREGFGWIYNQTTDSTSICSALQPSASLINTALANGLASGQAGFPGFPGWSAASSFPLAACPLLEGSPPSVSLTTGGTQVFTINAGRNHGGDLYGLAGTVSGTSPGITIGSFLVPLNPDAYFTFSLMNPNTAPLANNFGLLDANGHAMATVTVPPASPASLVGTIAHHAYGVVNGVQLVLVSDPVVLTLTP